MALYQFDRSHSDYTYSGPLEKKISILYIICNLSCFFYSFSYKAYMRPTSPTSSIRFIQNHLILLRRIIRLCPKRPFFNFVLFCIILYDVIYVMDQMNKTRISRMFYKAYVGRLAATTMILDEGVKYEMPSHFPFNTRFGNLCIFGRSPIFDRIYNSSPICRYNVHSYCI